MMETKFERNWELSWCGVNGILTSVQKIERARKGVSILLNNGWHSAVIDFGCVSSRITWIIFKFPRLKVCVVVGYGFNGGNDEEKEIFWNELDRIVDIVGN